MRDTTYYRARRCWLRPWRWNIQRYEPRNPLLGLDGADRSRWMTVWWINGKDCAIAALVQLAFKNNTEVVFPK
jgi:hypothetical protein